MLAFRARLESRRNVDDEDGPVSSGEEKDAAEVGHDCTQVNNKNVSMPVLHAYIQCALLCFVFYLLGVLGSV